LKLPKEIKTRQDSKKTMKEFVFEVCKKIIQARKKKLNGKSKF